MHVHPLDEPKGGHIINRQHGGGIQFSFCKFIRHPFAVLKFKTFLFFFFKGSNQDRFFILRDAIIRKGRPVSLVHLLSGPFGKRGTDKCNLSVSVPDQIFHCKVGSPEAIKTDHTEIVVFDFLIHQHELHSLFRIFPDVFISQGGDQNSTDLFLIKRLQISLFFSDIPKGIA